MIRRPFLTSMAVGHLPRKPSALLLKRARDPTARTFTRPPAGLALESQRSAGRDRTPHLSGATPDEETYKAVKPGTASLPGSIIIGTSSPYRKKGQLYKKFQDHYGTPNKVLKPQQPCSIRPSSAML
jgi:hypothetical protein